MAKRLEWEGVSYTQKQLAAKVGVSGEAMRQRLKHWSLEHAATLPPCSAAPLVTPRTPKKKKPKQNSPQAKQTERTDPPSPKWMKKLEL